MKDIMTDIKEITRINLQSDEVLLLHFEADVNHQTMRNALESFKDLFPNNRVVAVAGNIKLEAVKGS